MIDFLRGRVAHTTAEYVVLDVHGVGYRVFCANPYTFEKSGGNEATVYVHHHVREDAMLLYGFASRDEQELFRKLLDVSGIGPRVALAALSGSQPLQLVAAIRREDIAYLTKLPGIGRKTAQRMVLDLKDKLGAETHLEDGAFAPGDAGAAAGSSGSAGWREAKEGLLSLGFSAAELDRIWPELRAEAGEEAAADVLMKLALKQLYRG